MGARDADRLLGDKQDAALFLDESSFLKKENASVGVQRQWPCKAGKVESCEVGVFACLGRGGKMDLTDFQLCVPGSWASDDARFTRAKTPKNTASIRPNGSRF